MDNQLVVLPGDDLTELIAKRTAIASSTAKVKGSPAAKYVIGPGLRREANNRIVAVKCGQLMSSKETCFWLDSQFKRYIASRADKVIGFVINKSTFMAKVDIGTNEPATLDLLAFPNATKKNKGQVEVGDAIYATIVTDCVDVETELTCVTSDGKKGGMGVLSSKGYVVTVPTHISRRLLSPESKLISTLGKKYKFEISIGMNGRVWVCAKNPETTIAIVNFIESLEHIPRCQYQEICEEMVNGFVKVGRK